MAARGSSLPQGRGRGTSTVRARGRGRGRGRGSGRGRQVVIDYTPDTTLLWRRTDDPPIITPTLIDECPITRPGIETRILERKELVERIVTEGGRRDEKRRWYYVVRIRVPKTDHDLIMKNASKVTVAHDTHKGGDGRGISTEDEETTYTERMKNVDFARILKYVSPRELERFENADFAETAAVLAIAKEAEAEEKRQRCLERNKKEIGVGRDRGRVRGRGRGASCARRGSTPGRLPPTGRDDVAMAASGADAPDASTELDEMAMQRTLITDASPDRIITDVDYDEEEDEAPSQPFSSFFAGTGLAPSASPRAVRQRLSPHVSPKVVLRRPGRPRTPVNETEDEEDDADDADEGEELVSTLPKGLPPLYRHTTQSPAFRNNKAIPNRSAMSLKPGRSSPRPFVASNTTESGPQIMPAHPPRRFHPHSNSSASNTTSANRPHGPPPPKKRRLDEIPISAETALAEMSRPPAGAEPGSVYAPWFKLTDHELMELRARYSRNVDWMPPDSLIQEELERKGRGKANWIKADKNTESVTTEMRAKGGKSSAQSTRVRSGTPVVLIPRINPGAVPKTSPASGGSGRRPAPNVVPGVYTERPVHPFFGTGKQKTGTPMAMLSRPVAQPPPQTSSSSSEGGKEVSVKRPESSRAQTSNEEEFGAVIPAAIPAQFFRDTVSRTQVTRTDSNPSDIGDGESSDANSLRAIPETQQSVAHSSATPSHNAFSHPSHTNSKVVGPTTSKLESKGDAYLETNVHPRKTHTRPSSLSAPIRSQSERPSNSASSTPSLLVHPFKSTSRSPASAPAPISSASQAAHIHPYIRVPKQTPIPLPPKAPHVSQPVTPQPVAAGPSFSTARGPLSSSEDEDEDPIEDSSEDGVEGAGVRAVHGRDANAQGDERAAEDEDVDDDDDSEESEEREDIEEEYTISAILDHSYQQGTRWYLVKWEGYEATDWLAEDALDGAREMVAEYNEGVKKKRESGKAARTGWKGMGSG